MMADVSAGSPAGPASPSPSPRTLQPGADSLAALVWNRPLQRPFGQSAPRAGLTSSPTGVPIQKVPRLNNDLTSRRAVMSSNLTSKVPKLPALPQASAGAESGQPNDAPHGQAHSPAPSLPGHAPAFRASPRAIPHAAMPRSHLQAGPSARISLTSSISPILTMRAPEAQAMSPEVPIRPTLNRQPHSWHNLPKPTVSDFLAVSPDLVEDRPPEKTAAQRGRSLNSRTRHPAPGGRPILPTSGITLVRPGEKVTTTTTTTTTTPRVQPSSVAAPGIASGEPAASGRGSKHSGGTHPEGDASGSGDIVLVVEPQASSRRTRLLHSVPQEILGSEGGVVTDSKDGATEKTMSEPQAPAPVPLVPPVPAHGSALPATSVTMPAMPVRPAITSRPALPSMPQHPPRGRTQYVQRRSHGSIQGDHSFRGTAPSSKELADGEESATSPRSVGEGGASSLERRSLSSSMVPRHRSLEATGRRGSHAEQSGDKSLQSHRVENSSPGEAFDNVVSSKETGDGTPLARSPSLEGTSDKTGGAALSKLASALNDSIESVVNPARRQSAREAVPGAAPARGRSSKEAAPAPPGGPPRRGSGALSSKEAPPLETYKRPTLSEMPFQVSSDVFVAKGKKVSEMQIRRFNVDPPPKLLDTGHKNPDEERRASIGAPPSELMPETLGGPGAHAHPGDRTSDEQRRNSMGAAIGALDLVLDASGEGSRSSILTGRPAKQRQRLTMSTTSPGMRSGRQSSVQEPGSLGIEGSQRFSALLPSLTVTPR